MIYFDNAATTQPNKTYLNNAAKFCEELYFNPSALYGGGVKCAAEIKQAKTSVLKNLGLNDSDYQVIFTSCGTESDNLAIFGMPKRFAFLTSEGEHAAVYNSFLRLKEDGVNVLFCPLNEDGSVNTDALFKIAEENNVGFVSVIHVNNETGAINDITYIADRLKKINPNIIFHADGVQAYGKIPFLFSKNIDLYSISAHKINALKGTGALIVKKGVNLKPIIIGGGQENKLRSGTENVFGIKVFEYAGTDKYFNINENFALVSKIKKHILDNLDKSVFTVISGENSSPYVLSVAVKGLRGETVMHALEEKGLYVGNGSACSSKSKLSRVITACGIDNKLAEGVIRISFSSENTFSEAEKAVEILNTTVKNLKAVMGK